MKILYLNSYLRRSDSEQGIWGRKLVDELRAVGIEVTTVPRYWNDSERDRPSARGIKWLRRVKRVLPASLMLSVIEPILVARGLVNTLRSWLQVQRNVYKAHDVVYGRVHYCDWAPWLVGWSLKRPVVLEIHAPQYLERTFRGRRSSRLLRAFERVQCRWASQMRVVSKQVAKLMEEEGIPTDRIRFIPYGVELFKPSDASLHEPGSAVKIVFAGSFCQYHGVEVLLRAFALVREELPRTRLELIGDGLTRADDMRLARALGIDDAVDFPGWLSREVMLERVASSDIAVAPFLALEPFWYDPVKILDYMSTGVAIIASSLERIKEILHNGRGGALVAPGDVGALAEEIKSLACSPERRSRLGAAAQAILVEDCYLSDSVLQRVVSLCSDAIRGGEVAGKK